MDTVSDGPTTSQVYFQINNNFDVRGAGGLSQLHTLVVWGGLVANCGEDNLSRLVDFNAAQLQFVTYCPDRTKGGALIRPKYYQGDRGGRETFPKLINLTIRLEPALLPKDYGWITPELTHLRLLCVTAAVNRSRDNRGASIQDTRVPCRNSVRTWIGAGNSPKWSESVVKGFPEQMRSCCPKLESIVIAFCSTQDEAREETDWITLHPPRPLSWDIRRLLVLPVVKPVHIDQEVAGDTWATIRSSPLSGLTMPLLHTILSFLESPQWTHRRHEISTFVAERHGLPDELRMCTFDDLVRDSRSAW